MAQFEVQKNNNSSAYLKIVQVHLNTAVYTTGIKNYHKVATEPEITQDEKW